MRGGPRGDDLFDRPSRRAGSGANRRSTCRERARDALVPSGYRAGPYYRRSRAVLATAIERAPHDRRCTPFQRRVWAPRSSRSPSVRALPRGPWSSCLSASTTWSRVPPHRHGTVRNFAATRCRRIPSTWITLYVASAEDCRTCSRSSSCARRGSCDGTLLRVPCIPPTPGDRSSCSCRAEPPRLHDPVGLGTALSREPASTAAPYVRRSEPRTRLPPAFLARVRLARSLGPMRVGTRRLCARSWRRRTRPGRRSIS